MRELNELLNSILEQATFHVPFVGDLTHTQLREAFGRKGWPPDKEMFDARSAQPVVSDKSLSPLGNYLRGHLADYIDPESDRIGHAFPAGYDPSRHVHQESGLVGEAWVSPVRDFARSLLKGAAILDPETMSQLITGWLRGQSVAYKTRAVLNALPVRRPLQLDNGVRIDLLPRLTDELPANLPGHMGMAAEEYLDRTLLSIDCTAKPAFFRPASAEAEPDLKVVSRLNVHLQTFCHALALESNSFVDVAIYYNEFRDARVFPLSNNSSSWQASSAGLKKRPYLFSLRHRPLDGVTELVPEAGGPVLNLSSEQLAPILNSFAEDNNAAKIKLAIERWVASKDFEKNEVDSLIDLRIALESLYLKGLGSKTDRGELSFRLSLYGAWHLGTCFEERKRVYETLRGAYNKASRAVHGSDFSVKPDIQELLAEAQNYCRQGLLKLLIEGPPSNMDDMILGAERKGGSFEHEGET